MRRRAVLVPLVAGVLALAGCTASVDGVGTQASVGATTASSAAAPSGSGSAGGQDVEQLVTQGFDSLLAADGVHIVTTVSGSDAGTIDIRYGKADAIGTISTGGQEVEIRRTPKDETYFKAAQEFWESTGVPAAAADTLGGKYVHITKDTKGFDNFTTLLDLTTFVSSIREGSDYPSAELKGTETVDGVEAYVIGDEGTDDGALYLAVAGGHAPVKIVSTANGTVAFDGYGDAPDVAEPPANQVVELPS